MKPIRIQIWKRSPYLPLSWNLSRTLLAPSWSTAERLARSELGSVVTTTGCYHRDRGRSDYATLTRGRSTRHVEPAMSIVASVGQLGWSP